MKKSLHLLAVCIAVGLAVSACGSGQNGQGSGAPAGQQNAEGGGPGGGGFPGGSGKVAAVAGSTAQVQGQGGQVAVTWTSATKFSQQVSATVTDLKVGDCVVAVPASPSSGDTSTVAAASVRISTAANGSCTGGFRGQGGQGGQAGQGGDGSRTDQGNPPEGAPSGQARPGGFGAFGKVTAVSGTGFSVESARPGSTDTTTVRVTTSSDTTFAASAKATSKDVKVGRCVASFGKTDSTGAITAATITLSQPVNGQCAAMFGGFGRGRPDGTGQQGEGTQNS